MGLFGYWFRCNFILREVVKNLKLKLVCYEFCEILKVNGIKVKFMLIFVISIVFLNGRDGEEVEFI